MCQLTYIKFTVKTKRTQVLYYRLVYNNSKLEFSKIEKTIVSTPTNT